MNKKVKSKAYLKAESKRDEMNAGRLRVVADDLSCVVYLYTNKIGSHCAIGYKKRSVKNLFHRSFGNEDLRKEYYSTWMNEQIALNTRTLEKNKTRSLAVDDVLYSSWGYEQTNIDFYMVIRLVGKQSVELVKIAGVKDYASTGTGKNKYTFNDQGTCKPDTNTIISEPFIRRVSDDSVTVDSTRHASKVEYKEIDGKRVYRSFGWSSSH